MANVNKIEGGFSGGLHTAASAVSMRQLAAGPFDISAVDRESDTITLPDALITGLLIIYPTVATVVAVMVGLALIGPAGGI